MKVGDLVKIVQSYSGGWTKAGVVVEIRDTGASHYPVPNIKVYWSDAAASSVEAQTSLEVINESR